MIDTIGQALFGTRTELSTAGMFGLVVLGYWAHIATLKLDKKRKEKTSGRVGQPS